MSDNINTRRGYDTDLVRAIDKNGIKTVIVGLDLGGAGAESLASGTLAVSGPLTDSQLRASPVNVAGALTDAELRASAVPISGTVSVSGSLAVTGTFWQTTQPVSAASLPLPSGAAAESTLAALNAKVTSCNTGAVVVSTLPKAREDSAAMTWVSAKTAAPTANAVQCDSGALAAGDYDFDVQLAISDTVAVGKGLVIEHRNSANGATLFNLGGSVPGTAIQIRLRRYTIATNERLRVIAGTVAGAASSMYLSSIGRRLS